MKVITNEFIQQGASYAGGWSRFQLALLGVDWPPLNGWRQRILGTEISDKAAAAFLEAKHQRLGKMKSHSRRAKVAQQEREMVAQLRGG